jgi:hypothetical protein
MPIRLAGTLVTRGCASVTCESFFIYCSWLIEGHDTHASLEPLCVRQPGPELSATWWLPNSLAGLGDVRHTAAPEPPEPRGGSLELPGVWQYLVLSLGEQGSRATGLIATCGCLLRP